MQSPVQKDIAGVAYVGGGVGDGDGEGGFLKSPESHIAAGSERARRARGEADARPEVLGASEKASMEWKRVARHRVRCGAATILYYAHTHSRSLSKETVLNMSLSKASRLPRPSRSLVLKIAEISFNGIWHP